MVFFQRFHFCAFTVSVLVLSLTPAVYADLRDIHVTDVTARAFSVVWIGDEAVRDAKIRVFRDVLGATEITQIHTRFVSSEIPGAHGAGFGKIDVFGLEPDSIYYFQLVSTSLSGGNYFPEESPFKHVATANERNVVNKSGASTLLPLLTLPTHGQKTNSPRLILADFPDFSDYPVSIFIEHSDLPSAAKIIDLNNVSRKVGGVFSSDQVVVLTEYSPIDECPEVAGRRALRYRKTSPLNISNPDMLTLVRCSQNDIDCNGAVDSNDLQILSTYLGAGRGDCEFNEEMDLDLNGSVDNQDADFVRDAIK